MFVTLTSFDSYHGLDPFWEQEAVVERVNSFIGFHVGLALQQNGACVKPIICPEHRETARFVTTHQRPVITINQSVNHMKS